MSYDDRLPLPPQFHKYAEALVKTVRENGRPIVSKGVCPWCLETRPRIHYADGTKDWLKK